MKRVVVDADMLPYSCGFAAKGEPLSHALQLAKKALTRICEETGVDTLELYIKGKGNFREDLAFTHGYKATRTAAKPDTYDDIRQYLMEQWGATQVDGMEADDKVSLILWEDFIAHNGDREECNVILSSPDKDLKNTPGWHHYPRSGEVKWVTPYQAERHFYYQMLEGDQVDNIKGLPLVSLSDVQTYELSKQAMTKGCGKASAKKLMASNEAHVDPEAFVWERYMQWGLFTGLTHEEVRVYFIEQAQLLWMTRELDSFGEPVLYKANEAKYEKAARQVYGPDIAISTQAAGEHEGDDLFSGGEEEGSTEPAGGGDHGWDSFCTDSAT